MKRVKAACITQTLHFLLKDGVDNNTARRLVQEEVVNYKTRLDKSRIRYKILSEETQPDGTVILEIKRQYNTSPVGEYLN